MEYKKILKKEKGQEEMVGFVIIIIMVAIIGLIFLGFSIEDGSEGSMNDYQVNSFIQAALKATTNCTDSRGYHKNIQELISDCNMENDCADGRETCEVLDKELRKMTKSAWDVGPRAPNKAYQLNITTSDNEKVLSVSEGNKTANYRGSSQALENINVKFRIYN